MNKRQERRAKGYESPANALEEIEIIEEEVLGKMPEMCKMGNGIE